MRDAEGEGVEMGGVEEYVCELEGGMLVGGGVVELGECRDVGVERGAGGELEGLHCGGVGAWGGGEWRLEERLVWFGTGGNRRTYGDVKFLIVEVQLDLTALPILISVAVGHLQSPN